MEPLKVGDLVIHGKNENLILKIEHIYKDTVPERCRVSSIKDCKEQRNVYTRDLTKAPPITIAEYCSILTTASNKIIGDLVKIPGYEAFILIDGKPFQLKKDDNEL